MYYDSKRFIPYIPSSEYDKIAHEFLEQFYPDALREPIPVPIEQVAKDSIGLDVKYICLSEELDIFGMTIFSDGLVEVYDHDEMLYSTKEFKAKTVLIDPEAVRKTNIACRNNTIAHECVHWYKHRYYYKMQNYFLPKYAKYCKCRIDQLLESSDEESIMEAQAVGIAPRILMPKETFTEASEHLNVSYGKDNRQAILTLAELFNVSKRSVEIRLEECNIL